MRWAGHVARVGEKRTAYRLLAGKQEGKRLLVRPRCRWVENIEMDLVYIRWGSVDWIGRSSSGLLQAEGICEHGNKPLGSIKCCYGGVVAWFHKS
jgi:hypothetical protein